MIKLFEINRWYYQDVKTGRITAGVGLDMPIYGPDKKKTTSIIDTFSYSRIQRFYAIVHC